MTQGCVRSETSEKLEFDDLLNENAMFLRSQGLQNKAQMVATWLVLYIVLSRDALDLSTLAISWGISIFISLKINPDIQKIIIFGSNFGWSIYAGINTTYYQLVTILSLSPC